ncbi:MAG: alpha/beta fold hydrolase [Saprospiraceae bacterium]|nr:alpha/beta fold hydrolase [Saprospiraceae bacterium]
MYISLGNQQFRGYKSGHGSKIVILIPGGPGLTIDYLQTIHEMLPEDLFTVISYQPSGTFGNVNTPMLPSVRQYAEELRSILETLEIKSCYLLGHSWGGVIAQEFLRQFPTYPIEGIILANSFISGVQLKNALIKRAKQLPDNFYQQSQEILQSGQTDQYTQILLQTWIPNFLCRIHPLPDPILCSLTPLADSPVYYYYLGYDLLEISGALKYWNRTDSLEDITCPVLIMSGEYDYLSNEENQKTAAKIKDCQLWYEAGTSHMPMYEKPNHFAHALNYFLMNN